MCGIFFIFDPEKRGLDLEAQYSAFAVSGLQDRGPDGATSYVGKHSLALHCLLSITGATQQPVQWENGAFLFNGEIYNEWQKYSSTYGDADYLKKVIELDLEGTLKTLDGEFALIVHDEKENLLYLVSDTFGTKPFYYCIEGGRIGVASYDFILHDCGFTKPERVSANTVITIDLESLSKSNEYTARPFNFSNQHSESYETYADAFQLAIRKRSERVQRKLYVPVSSGHDSGAIAAELEALNIPFSAYGFRYGEVEAVFDARYERMAAKNITCEVLAPGIGELDGVQQELNEGLRKFRLTLDPSKQSLYADDDIRNVTGYIAAAYIAKTARSREELIALSGQGADEIISDYYNPYSNSRRSIFRGEWEKATRPWENFYGGWNRLFLEANERIVGHYGIETRYPFLDHAVVQAFLNLTPDMKRKRYKGCIAYRMDQLDYPYHDRKLGFAGYEREILDQSAVSR